MDSGAGASVISRILVESFGLLVFEPLLTVSAVNGQRVLLIGRTDVSLRLCGHTHTVSLHFMQDFSSNTYNVILGTDILAQFDVIIDIAKNRVFTTSCLNPTYAPHTVVVPARTTIQMLVPIGDIGCEEVSLVPNKLVLETRLLSAAHSVSKVFFRCSSLTSRHRTRSFLPVQT